MQEKEGKPSQVRSICLIVIMVSITLTVLGVAIGSLYQTALEEQRKRLVDTAQSRAAMMNAVASYDKQHSGAQAFEHTPGQIREAHRNFHGFGETGEFTLARREGDPIVFLLSHRHHDTVHLHPVAFDGAEAIPMQHALKGESGSIIGRDYRGENVLAAYEPVREMGLGIVAKIDMKEIRAPFIRAAYTTSDIALLLILLGSQAFRRITAGTARRVEHSEKLFRETFAHAHIGMAHVGIGGAWLRVNDALCDIVGYPREELPRCTFQDITHPEELDADLTQIKLTLAGDINTYSMETRYIRKDGSSIHGI
ncbi:MAG: hypothetical protein COZ02_10485 [Zetaproteobacteria bacterium CG_4_10_14_0_8_um_filter_59_127]|nr:MAG: hypothetical protein AUK36_07880 [Zetaproteobacteria bacterium CG2_30_59_37]PIY44997.1 MAG: hypothetical protein COZ02_10485 [Zetaproteobacteria bacterium CG_4_10_14_0_8_um_filter_59_127]